MNEASISILFDPSPIQWGLRGDPHLWGEMKSSFLEIPLPASEEELKSLVERQFEILTGKPFSTEERSSYIERFSHGGMSSGHISFVFWREVASPLLVSRYNKALK
ncbi:MAG: hypothetical protein HN855_07875 [Anaerolineae bacterium]|jgi:hypothetical protein|nr:hypothetical protein [Anaerolineae bacterium]MBT7069883.1 hypothetical protein [Anaerolineae bacterium]MBT7325059.1 hypothetical protein [Anaerolineae bacterium]